MTETKQPIKLTSAEQAAVVPVLARIHRQQELLNENGASLQSLITLIASNHEVSVKEYALSVDGTALVPIEPAAAGPQKVAATPKRKDA